MPDLIGVLLLVVGGALTSVTAMRACMQIR
jgi:hypothetical protein